MDQECAGYLSVFDKKLSFTGADMYYFMLSENGSLLRYYRFRPKEGDAAEELKPIETVNISSPTTHVKNDPKSAMRWFLSFDDDGLRREWVLTSTSKEDKVRWLAALGVLVDANCAESRPRQELDSADGGMSPIGVAVTVFLVGSVSVFGATWWLTLIAIASICIAAYVSPFFREEVRHSFTKWFYGITLGMMLNFVLQLIWLSS